MVAALVSPIGASFAADVQPKGGIRSCLNAITHNTVVNYVGAITAKYPTTTKFIKYAGGTSAVIAALVYGYQWYTADQEDIA